MLGTISGKYESGNLGYDAIAHNPSDPGGSSYGKWQLSQSTGTLTDFINKSGYSNYLSNLTIGSPEFDIEWKELAKDPQFCFAQYTYIYNTHYLPVFKYWHINLQMDDCNALEEALWSMSVQHSYNGCVKIISLAMFHIPDSYTDADCINQLYNAREQYVRGLNLNINILNSLINRYHNERIDVLKLL